MGEGEKETKPIPPEGYGGIPEGSGGKDGGPITYTFPVEQTVFTHWPGEGHYGHPAPGFERPIWWKPPRSYEVWQKRLDLATGTGDQEKAVAIGVLMLLFML